ncbi:MAG: Intracellular distribution of mitochondria [Thelocarpon superellum]|nr:MAG: Intracellular distribution of mitochondria [Thelocarpon superellum]
MGHETSETQTENAEVVSAQDPHDATPPGAASAIGGGPATEIPNAEVNDGVFQLTIKLPHEPHEIRIMVSTQEQMQDIRQTIVEYPDTLQYSCFHLELDGRRINDFIELSDVEGLTPESALTLVEDPYTEKDARMHVVRVRELLGAGGDRTDTLLGIDAGLSLHDDLAVTATTSLPSANGHADPTSSAASASGTGDYNLDAPASWECLMAPRRPAPPKTVKALTVSHWNPPPPSLRQRGHLLYLLVTTLEGDQCHITASVAGFYLNKCSNTKFDPFPRTSPKDLLRHSLLSLLSAISPSFGAAFQALSDANQQDRDPLSTFQPTNAIPASPWLVSPASCTLTAHQADLTRTQESYLLGGLENAETLRDWNEEFQSTRELPRETVQERVFRERLTSKLFADYNEAAARGAILVARGEVAPLNPTESDNAQIFVYNNIFFSFGADGVGTFTHEGGDAAARVATGKDVAGVRRLNQLDVPGLFTPGTVVVDYLGRRLVAQSIVPGIFKQREPGEHQIDYGGVEGKDVVATHGEFVAPFSVVSKALHTKKHAVWDKEGRRHELEGSVETKGLLGTDGRKYALDLYRITPLDIAWLEEHWIDLPHPLEASSEVKTNGDSRGVGYPHRMAVLRPELVDAFWKSKLAEFVNAELTRRKEAAVEGNDVFEPAPSSNGTALEPIVTGGGAVTETATETATELEKATATKLAEADRPAERVDVSGFDLALNPDVFNGQNPATPEEREEQARDERHVRDACAFLTDQVLPELMRDLDQGDVGFPMDGDSLTRLLHKRGINVRYSGTIAKLARGKGPRMLALQALAEREMVARAFKHVSNRYLRFLPVTFAASCTAHLLNQLLYRGADPAPTAVVDDEMRRLYSTAELGFTRVDGPTMRHDLEEEVRRRYGYTLSDDWASRLPPLPMLREVAQKLGLQLVAKDYHFDGHSCPVSPDVDAVPDRGRSPVTANGHFAANGHATAPAPANGGGGKKKKKARDASSSTPPRPSIGVQPDDIVNVVPVIKDAAPKSVLAAEALEAGRISMAQGQKELGQELLLESLSLHEQIYGILHPEVARVYGQLSMLYFQLEEKSAAVELARKAVIVSERTLGVDAADTVLSYLNLTLFEHGNGNTRLALAYVQHALELWKMMYGAHHPDSITTINNGAVMLQHLRCYHESRVWFEASVTISEQMFGRQSPHTATLLYQLAQALALDQDSKGAVSRMREAFNIYTTTLGPQDKNTKEAEHWLEQLTQNAVSIARHAKDVQARRVRRGPMTPRVTLGMRAQPAVGQSALEVGAVPETATSTGGRRRSLLDSRSIDELLKFIEGSEGRSRAGTGSGTGSSATSSSTKKRPGRGNPKRRGGLGTAAATGTGKSTVGAAA